MNQLDYVNTVYQSQGNFVLVDFISQEIKNKMCEYLSDNQIFVRNLTHSDMLRSSLRITIGTQSQMSRVIEIMKQFNNN